MGRMVIGSNVNLCNLDKLSNFPFFLWVVGLLISKPLLMSYHTAWHIVSALELFILIVNLLFFIEYEWQAWFGHGHYKDLFELGIKKADQGKWLSILWSPLIIFYHLEKRIFNMASVGQNILIKTWDRKIGTSLRNEQWIHRTKWRQGFLW